MMGRAMMVKISLDVIATHGDKWVAAKAAGLPGVAANKFQDSAGYHKITYQVDGDTGESETILLDGKAVDSDIVPASRDEEELRKYIEAQREEISRLQVTERHVNRLNEELKKKEGKIRSLESAKSGAHEGSRQLRNEVEENHKTIEWLNKRIDNMLKIARRKDKELAELRDRLFTANKVIEERNERELSDQDDSIQIGDVVRLKSGGPNMTVKNVIIYDGGRVEVLCEWFDGTGQKDCHTIAFEHYMLNRLVVPKDIVEGGECSYGSSEKDAREFKKRLNEDYLGELG